METVGRTDATKVSAFTDGCPGLCAVLANVGVTRPPILDWFHIAMRLQHAKLAAANLSTDCPDRVTAKAAIVAEVECLHWRILNGKAKNAQRSIKRIRKVMHIFKGEYSQGAKAAASRKLWHALHAIDKYFRGQAAWLINYAKRYRAGARVGTSITEGTPNFLVNRCMNKSQQMRWSRRGPICYFRAAAQFITARLAPGLGIDLTGSQCGCRALLQNAMIPQCMDGPEVCGHCCELCGNPILVPGQVPLAVSSAAYPIGFLRFSIADRAQNARWQSLRSWRRGFVWPLRAQPVPWQSPCSVGYVPLLERLAVCGVRHHADFAPWHTPWLLHGRRWRRASELSAAARIRV
jgi:hypothetical protein